MKKLFTLLLLLIPVLYAHAQTTGTVKGQVMELGSNTPVANAELTLLGYNLTTRTDSLGRYEFTGVAVGYNIMQAEASGYVPRITESFPVSTAAPAIIDIQLQPTTKNLEEVTVTASPYRISLDAPVSMLRIGTQEIDLTPGANRDISKVLQSMPGVLSVSNSNRNDLLVRGGSANENRYYIDGIEIPVLNHFAVQGGSGGNASLVNTELLQSTNFFTSAFPVSYAPGLSSVMSMEMQEGNRERFHGKLIAGFTDAGLHINTPLTKEGKTRMTASWRTSYLSMLFSLLKLPFLPTYNDYQFKVTTDLTDKDKIFILGLGSLDNNRLNTKEQDLPASREYILGYLPNNDQTSFVGGIGYEHLFSFGRLRATVSGDYLYNRLYKYADNNEQLPLLFDIKDRETNLRTNLNMEWFDVKGFKIIAGVSGGAAFSSNVHFGRYAIYGGINRRFFDERLSASLSLRADGMTYSSRTSNPLRQLSPRLNLSARATDKLTVSASVARYFQEPTMTLLDYSGNDIEGYRQTDGLRYSAVNHYVAGVSFTPSSMTVINAEGFFKDYSQLPLSLLDGMPVTTSDFTDYIIGDVPARSAGKGHSYGVELSWRHMNLWNTTINTAYTFVRSFLQRTDAQLNPTGGYWSSPWDVRHIITLTAIHRFKRNWTLGAKWQFSGGLPYTPYDEERSSRIDEWEKRHRPYTDNTRFNEKRNPAYHQLDLRIDKTWYFKNWRIGGYIDVQNVYDFSVKGQDLLTPATDENGNKLTDPERPGHYVMERISHDLGGTILPTVGITVEF